jgi:hypothetical protein
MSRLQDTQMDMDKPWTGTNLTRFEEMRAAGMPKQLSRLASGRRLMDSRGTGFYGEKKYRMPGCVTSQSP